MNIYDYDSCINDHNNRFELQYIINCNVFDCKMFVFK